MKPISLLLQVCSVVGGRMTMKTVFRSREFRKTPPAKKNAKARDYLDISWLENHILVKKHPLQTLVQSLSVIRSSNHRSFRN